jgi:hypothetical protein
MKVGDLVTRKIKGSIDEAMVDKTGKVGIIIKKNSAGDPRHSCVDVFYGKSGKIYSIAERLIEVVSER